MTFVAFAEEKKAVPSVGDQAKGEMKKPRPPTSAPPRRVPKRRHDQPNSRKVPRHAFESTAESKQEESAAPASTELKFESGREAKGVLGVSAGARAQLLQSQREAALRRRSMQMRAGVLVRADGPSDRMSSDDLQHGPSVRTFSVPKDVPGTDTAACSVIRHSKQEREDSICNSGQEEDIARSRRPHYSSSNEDTYNPMLSSEKAFPLSEERDCTTPLSKVLGYNGEERSWERGQEISTTKQVDEKQSKAGVSNHLRSRDEQNKAVSTRESIETAKEPKMSRGEVRPSPFIEDDYAEREGGNMLEDDRENSSPFSFDAMCLGDPEKLKDFLMNPCPKDAGIIECYVKRHKSGRTALNPEYRVYLREGNVFLMTSKKRGKKKTSNYLISAERSDYNKNSSNIIGKLRSNFFGTEYTIYDTGRNPRDSDPFFDEKNDDSVRSELGAILYAPKINAGPRKMKVCINKTDEKGRSLRHWQPAHKDEEMAQVFKHRVESAMRKLVSFENRQPSWSSELGAFVLNFSGRVTRASVKNFQLVEETGNHAESVLQFGRVANDEFTLDFQWPMSPFQAFAIALSSCDSKLACD